MSVGGCAGTSGATAGTGRVQEEEAPIRPLLSLPLGRSLLTNVRRGKGRRRRRGRRRKRGERERDNTSPSL